MITLGKTKCRLLEHLLHHRGAPIANLVRVSGVTENTVRSHLGDFREEQLIAHGPLQLSAHGHPQYTYTLTVRGLIYALSEDQIRRNLDRIASAYKNVVPAVLGHWAYFRREKAAEMATHRLYNAVSALRSRETYLQRMDEEGLRDQLTSAFYFQEEDLAKWHLGEEHFELSYWGTVIQGDAALQAEVARIWETVSRFHWVRHRFIGYIGVKVGILTEPPKPETFPPLMEAPPNHLFAQALQDAENQRIDRYNKPYTDPL